VDPFVIASSNQSVDPAQIETNLANSKKIKKMYEMNHRFRGSWVAKLPWVEFIMGVVGKVTWVKCKVCTITQR
jgi:hypothetical protein